MPDLVQIQQLLAPLFPGLMGVHITVAASCRERAQRLVRPDLCTSDGILHGWACMAFADRLGLAQASANPRDVQSCPPLSLPATPPAPPLRARTAHG